MAFDPKAPPHVRYNSALATMKDYADLVTHLADAAYDAARLEASPGPRRTLLDLADSAAAFATRARAAKPLD